MEPMAVIHYWEDEGSCPIRSSLWNLHVVCRHRSMKYITKT
jgi:hypothetical protein